MKILIDPLYTQRPRICSSSYLAWQLIDAFVAWRTDVFIYLTYPKDKCEPEDLEFLSRHPDRVTLLDVPTDKTNRLAELYILRKEMKDILHPLNVNTWDIDVVISSHVPTIKHMCVHSQRSGSKDLPSYRQYIAMEDVQCLPFRDTVAWSQHLYPDTLITYAMAHATIFNGIWAKQAMKPVLKEVLSPAFQKRVLERVHEANSVKLGRLNVGRTYEGGDFNISFVGRITATRNFDGVADLFRKQFSYPIGPNKANIKFGISTNSQSSGAVETGEIDFIDIQMNDRPKFHEFLKKQHLVLNLSTVEDFSMSTYETLLAGCPMIVYDRPWNQFLGKEYPFRAKNEVEAYAMINAFAADYAKMYQLFVDWEASYWAKYIEGPENVTTAEVMIKLMTDFEAFRASKTDSMGKKIVERLQSIADKTVDLTPLAYENLPNMTHERRMDTMLGRIPSTLIWKMMAQTLGFKDTKKTGVMTRD